MNTVFTDCQKACSLFKIANQLSQASAFELSPQSKAKNKFAGADEILENITKERSRKYQRTLALRVKKLLEE